MKKFKKFAAWLTAVALCAFLPAGNAMTVAAAEPVTYCVSYCPSENTWRYQRGGGWVDGNEHGDLYYLYRDIKDGDTIVVEGTGDETLYLNVSARLANLTMNHASNVLVTATGYDECFILEGSYTVVNGDVSNAYVYNDATCFFNNNVSNLQIIGTGDDINAQVVVAGTAGHVVGKDASRTYYDLYNFAKGKLSIEDGSIRTEEAYYSTTPSAAQNTTPASTTQQASSAGNADEYDEVPKTGDSTLIYWILLGASALCFMGKKALKKM